MAIIHVSFINDINVYFQKKMEVNGVQHMGAENSNSNVPLGGTILIMSKAHPSFAFSLWKDPEAVASLEAAPNL